MVALWLLLGRHPWMEVQRREVVEIREAVIMRCRLRPLSMLGNTAFTNPLDSHIRIFLGRNFGERALSQCWRESAHMVMDLPIDLLITRRARLLDATTTIDSDKHCSDNGNVLHLLQQGREAVLQGQRYSRDGLAEGPSQVV